MMAIEKGIAHRPGAFKQSNKEHKHGRHRSKGSINISTKGKVSVKTISKKLRKELNKEQRRNQALQIRQKKREEVLAKKRSLGGNEYAPFLVCVVPLCKNLDCNSALNILMQCDEEATVNKSSAGITHIGMPRFKQRFSFITPQIEHQLAVLDCLKVSDTVLFLISAAMGIEDTTILIDNWGNTILTSSLSQGLPTPVVAITDLESITPKKRHEHKQLIQKLVNKWLPEEKVMVLDKNVDGVNILRRIGNQKRKSILYRDRRPHLLAEEVEYLPEETGTLGTLKVTGYLRGTALSVNQLIHIPGLGDFQMAQIDALSDPNKINNKTGTSAMDVAESISVRVLERCDSTKQESLDSENIPDPMDAEQTWPTNEEIEMAEKEQNLKKVKKVPKGWSEYQAAWIPDDDAEFELDESESEEEGSDKEYLDVMSEDNSEKSNIDDDNDFKSVTESEVAPNDEKYDKEMDLYAEKEALAKLKAAKTDQQFPDEIDTPMDQPARVRFQKYRGLESFRTSPWDSKENLPSDYGRIFQFENFDRTKKRILKEQEEKDGALPGWYLTIHIKDVSQLLWSTFKQSNFPLVLIGLFSHEHKMSVLNTVLRRTQHYDLPIKSKERLIFQCGYRRFFVNPIFSSHTNGQKHKFERFFQPDSTVVATFYGRIQFPPAPVLCFKEVNNELVLVATGSLLSCNPDRLVIKRLVLSGHPLKINKRSAVIRFMFFNREDIMYFKPCKLRTKMGRTGHIKEPLGTHGHMKCVFDGQLTSQDTVLLNLYKRVFPKWTYEDLIVSCVNNNENMET
ncbi:pre-rRNA-processing protein TSR1 homolog [Anoplophora glabripennis]|nr:pre-rRNA-processing protein TSR1 homolog [Anoplophora glabripennis]